jgi:protein PET117
MKKICINIWLSSVYKYIKSQSFIRFYRTNLHEGVIRDVERQRRRQAENLYRLQQQIDLSKELKKSQLESISEHE